ncbi:cytochrome c3 family protein [Deferrisoma sp.]
MAAQDNEDHTRFDIGTADEIATCTSCHMGGGAYEFDRFGNRYDEFFTENREAIEAGEFGRLNGDYYRYDIEDIGAAPFYMARDLMGGGPSPALSAPHLHDWGESGVLEAECLTCHLDPYENRLHTADGVDAQNYAPRLKIFVIAKMNEARDDYADILAISVGRYPTAAEVPEGYEVFSIDRYSSPLSGTFEGGKFYAAPNSPVASTRDSVKVPMVEGGKPDEAGGTSGFKMHNAYNPAANVVTAANRDKVWGSRKFLGYYFKYAATGGLMGLDLDGDGVPLAYVKLVKKPGVTLGQVPDEVQNYFTVETYYDPDDLALFAAQGGTKAPLLASEDTGSHKWDLICGRCHVGFRDPENEGLYIRPDVMGMKADIPKRGTFWKMKYEEDELNYDLALEKVERGEKSLGDLAGYDVHAARGVECVDCHATKAEGPAAPDHNFGKGIDTGGTVRNDLDFQKVKVCTDCHGLDQMTLAHRDNFGSEEIVADHFEHVACETCHIPYKRYWPFRAFDYSMGFTYNFDSRFMPNPADPGDVSQMVPFSFFGAFGIQDPQPGYYAAAPFYGIGGLQWAGQSNPLFGMDVVTSIAYFDPNGPDPLVAEKLKLEGKTPGFGADRPLDPYAMFYTLMTDPDGSATIPTPDAEGNFSPESIGEFFATANGKSYFEFTPVLYKKPDRDGKIKIYPGNPVAAVTWVYYEPEDPASMRVLAPRELNSILAGAVSREVMPGRHQMGIVLRSSTFTQDETGAITDYDPATIVWDDNFDLRPEISNETELDLVRRALVTVLEKEDEYAGRASPDYDKGLRLAIVAHYFTVTHNVLPASQALGAAKDYDKLGGAVPAGKTPQCVDCHAQGTNPVQGGDPDVVMNARLSNRTVTFLPWTIENFDELVAKGKIWVEPEIGYVHGVDVNRDGDTDDVSPDFSTVGATGMVTPGDLIGASQAEILEHTEEAAHAFAKLAGLTPVEPGEEPVTAEEPHPTPTPEGDSGSTGCFLQTLSRP